MRNHRAIKAVFFDLGGVIFLRDRMFARVLEVFAPDDPELFWNVYNSEAMPFCRGEIDKPKFFRNLAAKVGRQVPEETLANLCRERFHQNRVADAGVLSLIEMLRKNYRLGLISNITEEFADGARQMGIFGLFDEVLLSYELGLTKDKEQIFTLALSRMGVAPDEAVFVDDYQPYVDVARTVGIHGVLFKDSVTLRTHLDALGVEL